jgi:hypothetical protein
MPPKARTTQNSLLAAGLAPAREDPSPIVSTFASFTQRRASTHGTAHSISELVNRPHPETPSRTTTADPPDDENPEPDNETIVPGGGPPDGDDDPWGDPQDDADDDDNDEDELNAQDRVFLRLSQAINNLARNSRRPSASEDSKVKVREPDTFDGSEPRKLRAFFVQCELNFQSKPRAFRSDRAKVTFAQSYLKGMALEWFEPDLLSGSEHVQPDWMDDYAEFMLELQTNFGPHDPVGDAEMQLEQLYMRDGQRINKYIVEFQRLASQVRGWGDGALRRQFYNGLPARIKDEICRQGKPGTLAQFKTLAQLIDARYWERKGEVSRESKPSTSVPPKQSSSERTTSGNDKSGSHNSGYSKPANHASSSSSSAPKGPDLSNKLGKDGKLTSEERQRRLEKKLCLFCGGPGHTARDCTKSTSRAAKGRAATIAPEAKPDASDEAKK